MVLSCASVGDIISVSLLIKDILLALDSTRDSSAQYQSIVKELYVLDISLLQVEKLAKADEVTSQVHAIYDTAKETAEKCKGLVAAFLQRIKDYDKSLNQNGSGNQVKDFARKLKWKMAGMEEEASKFRSEIMGHSESINMLLATIQVTNLNMLSTNLSSQAAYTKQSLEDQRSSLDEINRRIEETKQIILSRDSKISTISERVQWLKNLGTELKAFMRWVILGNITLYREILSLRLAFTSHIDRSISEEPFVLEDPIGRISLVHLRFVDSWDAFDAVMETRFRGKQGLRKIVNKQFTLEDARTGKEISRKRNIEDAILPGQRIAMAIIFLIRLPISKPTRAADVWKCPRCQTICDESTDKSIQCINCNLCFRQIQSRRKLEPSKYRPLGSRREPVQFGKSSFQDIGTSPTVTHGPAVFENVEDELNYYKRVRIISEQTYMSFPEATAFQFSAGANLLSSFSTFPDIEKQALFLSRIGDASQELIINNSPQTSIFLRKEGQPGESFLDVKDGSESVSGMTRWHEERISVTKQIRGSSSQEHKRKADENINPGMDSTADLDTEKRRRLNDTVPDSLRNDSSTIIQASTSTASSENNAKNEVDSLKEIDAESISDDEESWSSLNFNATQILDKWGRRYHEIGYDHYLLPTDEPELERLDLQHGLFGILLKEKLCLSPIGENPLRILDVATGSGIWAIDAADKYPSANVEGRDICAIQPVWVPPNCRFYIQGANELYDEYYWLHGGGLEQFDFIHRGFTSGAIKDHEAVMSGTFSALNPGGWAEIQDFEMQIVSNTDNDSIESLIPHTLEWIELYKKGCAEFGASFCKAEQQKQWMLEAGFEQIELKKYSVPIGPWARDTELKTIGRFQLQNMMSLVNSASYGCLGRVAGWTEKQCEELINQVHKELKAERQYLYMEFYCLYGQKPR